MGFVEGVELIGYWVLGFGGSKAREISGVIKVRSVCFCVGHVITCQNCVKLHERQDGELICHRNILAKCTQDDRNRDEARVSSRRRRVISVQILF